MLAMANYEHLPIFKKMLELAVYIEDVAARFPRYHKYTLGSELRILCHEALSGIVEANQVKERREALLRLRLILERIKIHLMLAREVRAFHNGNSFGHAAGLVVDVSRQNEGWLRSQAHDVLAEAEKKRGPESPS
jgi:hypothetical protein